MALKRKVLIVDDDKEYCNYLTSLLSVNEYEPIVAHSVGEARELLSSHCPDITLLELNLPNIGGLEMVSAVRSWSLLPIIILSECNEENCKVEAMDAGVDDYIVKPCTDNELLARMRMAFRHTRTGETADEELEFANDGVIRIGGLIIDYNKYRVYLNGKDAGLTLNEYRIVAMLAKEAGNVITYDKIMKELWGPNAGRKNDILRVNMTNIRKKLREEDGSCKYIITENGVGYRMITEKELEK